jgi:hypothetical protein
MMPPATSRAETRRVVAMKSCTMAGLSPVGQATASSIDSGSPASGR